MTDGMDDGGLRLAAQLRKARHVVVLTGAGMSAESGIPTFRDSLTGLWARFNPEALATEEAFRRDAALVWGWYEWRRMRVLQSEPNAGHRALAALARTVARLTLVTQNVDDLHERAGSSTVLHLHGSLHAPRCLACARSWSHPPGLPAEPEGGRRLDPPRCSHCGGLIRPGVVWFGENLPARIWEEAENAAADCDLLLAIGTSGLVYPAADLPRQARRAGAQVVVINPGSTAQDELAHRVIRGPVGQVLPPVVAALGDAD